MDGVSGLEDVVVEHEAPAGPVLRRRSSDQRELDLGARGSVGAGDQGVEAGGLVVLMDLLEGVSDALATEPAPPSGVKVVENDVHVGRRLGDVVAPRVLSDGVEDAGGVGRGEDVVEVTNGVKVALVMTSR